MAKTVAIGCINPKGKLNKQNKGRLNEFSLGLHVGGRWRRPRHKKHAPVYKHMVAENAAERV